LTTASMISLESWDLKITRNYGWISQFARY